MHLTPRESEKLLLFLAGELAQTQNNLGATFPNATQSVTVPDAKPKKFYDWQRIHLKEGIEANFGSRAEKLVLHLSCLSKL